MPAKHDPTKYKSWWNREVAYYKGDELLHTGTIKEVADIVGVQPETIHFYTMPTAQRRKDRGKKQHMIIRVVALDE